MQSNQNILIEALNLLVPKAGKRVIEERAVKKVVEKLLLIIDDIHDVLPDESIIGEGSIRWTYIRLSTYCLSAIKIHEDTTPIMVLRNMKVALSEMVSIGIVRNLMPGVGRAMELRPEVASIPQDASSKRVIYRRLAACCEAMLKLWSQPHLRTMITENCLHELICGLMQLAYGPVKFPDDEEGVPDAEIELNRTNYLEALNKVLKDVTPAVAMEAVLMMGGTRNKWLWSEVQTRTDTMLKSEHGVRALIDAILPANFDVGKHWRNVKVIVQLLLVHSTGSQSLAIHNQLLELYTEVDQNGRPIDRFQHIIAIYARSFCNRPSETSEKSLLNIFFMDNLLEYTAGNEPVNDGDITSQVQRVVSFMWKYFDPSIENPIPVHLLLPVAHVLFCWYVALQASSLTQTKTELRSLLRFIVKRCTKPEFNHLFRSIFFGEHSESITCVDNRIRFVLRPDNAGIMIVRASEDTVPKRKDYGLIFKSFVDLFEAEQDVDVLVPMFLFLLDTLAQFYISSNDANDSANIEGAAHFLAMFLGRKDALNVVTHFVASSPDISASPEDLLAQSRLYVTIVLGEKTANVLINSSESDEVFQLSEFLRTMLDLSDPLIPVRGHALLNFAKLIEAGNEELLNVKEHVYNVCLFYLKDADSYIYLNAIRALKALVLNSSDLLEPLCLEFCSLGDGSESTYETRVKVGEIIVAIVQAFDEETLTDKKTLLINTCMNGVRDEEAFIRASAYSLLAEVSCALFDKMESCQDELLDTFYDGARDISVEVRRAAVYMMRRLCNDLGDQIRRVFKNKLGHIYGALNNVLASDEDSQVQFHADIAIKGLVGG